MVEVRIQSTKNSPEIFLSPDGVIKIRGRSIHENAAEFFEPVDAWIAEYIKEPAEITCVDIGLEYFNSARARIFITLGMTIPGAEHPARATPTFSSRVQRSRCRAAHLRT